MLDRFLSKKLFGTILATVVVAFAIPLDPATQGTLTTWLWGLYLGSQGAVDAAKAIKK